MCYNLLRIDNAAEFMRTVIFLSQKRYDMYHFDALYDPSKYRFVAILEPATYQRFPQACKQYFGKRYQVERQEKGTAVEDFTLDYETTCDIVAREIAQAGGAEQLVIIAVDESNIILAALLRDKYHIPGPSYAEMTLYKNKLKMKAQLQSGFNQVGPGESFVWSSELKEF